LTFQNHTNRPLTDFGGKTSIFSHPVYLFLREFSLQDFRGGSVLNDQYHQVYNQSGCFYKAYMAIHNKIEQILPYAFRAGGGISIHLLIQALFLMATITNHLHSLNNHLYIHHLLQQ
ncbi:hypothetical protein MMS10_26360, partial [Escherichia coli]|nr:hypothetical protein [Escherichia coli]